MRMTSSLNVYLGFHNFIRICVHPRPKHKKSSLLRARFPKLEALVKNVIDIDLTVVVIVIVVKSQNTKSQNSLDQPGN
jgi:hypothetical protein